MDVSAVSDTSPFILIHLVVISLTPDCHQAIAHWASRVLVQVPYGAEMGLVVSLILLG